ncbi:protein-glutamate methylesterase/protein-glutamine glutaminase [Clostridium estertheticum]|uniref:protein-glutamate methylesterase/protein-glutamine glutaminase n=1 Tax=Clostridium estertheticum TaxID=238834 RepID=UPI001C7CAF28|nr:chemotaxis response regulator protein-glutamate methylesterase [Clostridium estertheticum]MBX4269190.1 chemotaxis response regulator protein-glutamate methylesterase [Clostridium estertheticum]WLC79451.1 chemotaxis response regulator protein-glutamate methylesterase [Clostridium estertheticum]
MVNKIKVFVVDDSALMRKIISDMINAETEMEVIGTARNGEELLSKIERLVPDVITLDIEMPHMDGITTLKRLKTVNRNVQAIMLSSSSKASTELTMQCLELGAFDFIAKPSGAISLDINKVKDELVQKIKLAYMQSESRATTTVEKRININKVVTRNAIERPLKVAAASVEAVVIGASTGGPKALYKVITVLPDNIGVPVLVVQHMPTGFTKAFAQRLNLNSKLKVVEASDGDLIQKNVVYIAPGGYHMEVGRDKKIHLNTEPTIWGVRPAVDKLFISATAVYGSRLLSVILTGMGRDGAKGTATIKDNGGITIAEHESTCTIYGMPKAAFETGKVDEVVPLENIAQEINRVVMRR